MRRFDNLSYRDDSIMSIVLQQEKHDALHKSGKKEKFHKTDGEQRCHVGQKQEDLRSLQRGTDYQRRLNASFKIRICFSCPRL